MFLIGRTLNKWQLFKVVIKNKTCLILLFIVHFYANETLHLCMTSWRKLMHELAGSNLVTQNEPKQNSYSCRYIQSQKKYTQAKGSAPHLRCIASSSARLWYHFFDFNAISVRYIGLLRNKLRKIYTCLVFAAINVNQGPQFSAEKLCKFRLTFRYIPQLTAENHC